MLRWDFFFIHIHKTSISLVKKKKKSDENAIKYCIWGECGERIKKYIAHIWYDPKFIIYDRV